MPVRQALVVDDSKSARLMLRKMLQGLGVTVDVAESGEEALNYLRDRHTDAVFMDHIMPGMDGLSALRKLKSDPATATIPVAMYTSRDDEPYRDEALAAGAIGVLTKPTMPGALKEVLELMRQALDTQPASSLDVELPTTERSRTVPQNLGETELPTFNAPAPNAPAPAKDKEQSHRRDQPTVSATAPKAHASIAAATHTMPAGIEPPSLAAIEKLINSKTEAAFYEATETQVLPLINDVVAKLRKEVEAGQKSLGQQIAEQMRSEQLTSGRSAKTTPQPAWSDEGLRAHVSSLLDERMELLQEHTVQRLAAQMREIATQACTTQEHDMTEHVVQKLNAQFTETIRRVATTVHDAAVAAAQQAVLEAINTQTAATEQHRRHVEAALADNSVQLQRRLRRLVYAASVVAAALGMGTAALVYWLR